MGNKTVFVPVPVPNDMRKGDVIVGFEKGFLIVKYKILRVCRSCGRKAKDERGLRFFEKNKNSRFGRNNRCNKCKAEEKALRERAKKISALLEANEAKESLVNSPPLEIPRPPTTYQDWIDFFSFASEKS